MVGLRVVQRVTVTRASDVGRRRPGATRCANRSTGRSSANQLTLAAKITIGSATTNTTNQLPWYSGQPSQSATIRRMYQCQR